MAYTTIDDPSVYFQAYAFTKSSGTGSATFAGNSDLQPDFLWVKARSNEDSHELWDSNRGVNSTLFSNVTEAEDTAANRIVSFDTDGFTWGNAGNLNAAGDFVSWAWKANGGTTSSNSDGDLTSTVQFNSTAKFSIITYTGKNPIEPLDVGHGMGEAPDVIIVKNRDRSYAWGVYHKDLTSPAENRYIQLNSSLAEITDSTVWRNEAPTSTIIKTGESAVLNQPNEDIVMYAWKEVQGYSKFGKYFGNGSTDGTFVYTGFKPACVITKETSSAGGNWRIFDDARIGYNPANYRLTPNEASTESTAVHLDLLSNGFKFRNTGTSYNGSGDEYVFMAWAENPFVTSTGIPTTAR